MKKRIMLVEDDPSHRKLYSSWLKIGGYDPRVVDDERGALVAAETIEPAAIIVDIRLPNVSGLDVIETLKGAPATRAIPVMALTVLQSQHDMEACYAAGADAFVSKPDHIASFLDKVSNLLR